MPLNSLVKLCATLAATGIRIAFNGECMAPFWTASDVDSCSGPLDVCAELFPRPQSPWAGGTSLLFLTSLATGCISSVPQTSQCIASAYQECELYAHPGASACVQQIRSINGSCMVAWKKVRKGPYSASTLLSRLRSPVSSIRRRTRRRRPSGFLSVRPSVCLLFERS